MFENSKLRVERAFCKAKGKVFQNGINVHWWRGRKNFGDLVTKELLSHFECTPIYSYDCQADLIGAGSLIQGVPKEFSGVILGTGIISDMPLQYRDSLDNCTITSVRGELSKASLGLDKNVSTGDLGLIANKLISRPDKKFRIGLLPHYVDKNSSWIKSILDKKDPSVTVIDVEDTAKSVANAIAECELIISSSLHGIIFADALGIPNIWCEISDNVVGKGFKFRDYNSSIDFEQTPYAAKQLGSLTDIDNFVSEKNYTLIQDKQSEITSNLVSVIKQLKG